MDTSNWINLGLLVVSVVAAGIAVGNTVVARHAAKEANETQKRLLDVEKQRDLLFDQLERTPNLSATKVELLEQGNVFAIDIDLTNLSRNAVHIIAAAIFSSEKNDLLGVGRFSRLVQGSEQIKALFGAETIPLVLEEKIEAGNAVTTINRSPASLMREADEVSLYFRYATTADTIYAVTYEVQDTHPLPLEFYINHKRMVPFELIEK